MSWRYIDFKISQFFKHPLRDLCLLHTLFCIAWLLVRFDAHPGHLTFCWALPIIHCLLPPFHICPTSHPSHCKKINDGILTSSIWSLNPHNISGKNIHPNLVPQSTFPTKLEQRKGFPAIAGPCCRCAHQCHLHWWGSHSDCHYLSCFQLFFLRK